MGRHKKQVGFNQENIDRFNTLLSIAMYDCRKGNKVNLKELEKALLNIDSSSFQEEVKQFSDLKSSTPEEMIVGLQKIDVCVTEKVKNALNKKEYRG